MRKQHSAAFKAKVVLAVLRETQPLSQLAAEFEIHPTLLAKWRDAALQSMVTGFERGAAHDAEEENKERQLAELYEQVGRLTLQVNWLKKNLASTLNRAERLTLLDGQGSELSLGTQAALLSVSRSSLYYRPRPAEAREVLIKRHLDEWYTRHPFLGSRKLVALLAREGIVVGRHTIRRYRAEMGLETLYPKPNLSKAGGKDHVVYPYLLRDLVIDHPNQVWGVDITYIRLVNGWMYLVAFLDWFSRLVVAWELSDTLELGFVLSCRDAALVEARPEIVDSDQGSHFTSERFTEGLRVAGVRISMDGRGRCMDNIFTERLWRSVKYEEVYLSEYANPREARKGIGRYLTFYNEERPHQALGYATPAEIHAMPPTGEAECFLKSAPTLS